jgi:hypothetical protein
MKSTLDVINGPPNAAWPRWFIWNWKGAILGAVFRGALFLVVNLSAGPAAALAAMGTQAGFRLTVGGFVSGMIERLCATRPQWLGTTLAFTIVPLFVHGVELLVHAGAGTPKLALGEIVSVSVTLLSTGFQLFAMRRGTLIAGAGRKSLMEDLAVLPRLIADFITSILRIAIVPIVRPIFRARAIAR